MATDRVVIPGIVKNGMVVPQNDIPLPEGAHVDILITLTDVTPELKAELDQWDKASDEAWASRKLPWLWSSRTTGRGCVLRCCTLMVASCGWALTPSRSHLRGLFQIIR
jgi:hypothetical protein